MGEESVLLYEQLEMKVTTHINGEGEPRSLGMGGF
jgi:hypothetical protein